MKTKWQIEVNDQLYFAPADYLYEFAKDQKTTIEELLAPYPQGFREQILNGTVLDSDSISILNDITKVSRSTWKRLDDTWQHGRKQSLNK